MKGVPQKKLHAALFCMAALLCCACESKVGVQERNSARAEVYLSAIGLPIGSVFFTDTVQGLEVHTNLKNLPQGTLSIFVYEQADTTSLCKSELPKLRVMPNGRARNSMVIKGIRTSEFRDCAVIIKLPVEMLADGSYGGPDSTHIANGIIRQLPK